MAFVVHIRLHRRILAAEKFVTRKNPVDFSIGAPHNRRITCRALGQSDPAENSRGRGFAQKRAARRPPGRLCVFGQMPIVSSGPIRELAWDLSPNNDTIGGAGYGARAVRQCYVADARQNVPVRAPRNGVLGRIGGSRVDVKKPAIKHRPDCDISSSPAGLAACWTTDRLASHAGLLDPQPEWEYANGFPICLAHRGPAMGAFSGHIPARPGRGALAPYLECQLY